jgi:uncharacterized membrane protein
MSAGNLIGSLWNTVFFAGLWIVLGAALDKVFKAFNTSIKVLPSLQDAVNGMGIVQTVWGMILIILFIVIWINYLMNENSQAGGGV